LDDEKLEFPYEPSVFWLVWITTTTVTYILLDGESWEAIRRFWSWG
jgi:hypothetical protein